MVMITARKMSIQQIVDELDAIAENWRVEGRGMLDTIVSERYDELEEELIRRRDAGRVA
jgi:hypothetical protein